MPSGISMTGEGGDTLLELARELKPRLRGWRHLAAFPLTLAAGAVLVILSPTEQVRLATLVFAGSSALLFGVSALYHRREWSPRLDGVLRRLDHSNIFLLIAGTYTP